MTPSIHLQPKTRREFLRMSGSGLGLIAFSQVAPAFLTHSVRAEVPKAERDRSILVLIQLAGGNDGLNTLVPYQDDHYYKLRPSLGLKKKDLHLLNDDLALHTACGEMAELFKNGELSIIQNVGYPNPNRSHFRSMEIWETASDSEDYAPTGWLGRFFDNACSGQPTDEPVGLALGKELPDAFLAEGDHNVFGLNDQGGQRGRSFNEDLLDALGAESPHGPEDNRHFLQHTLMNALVSERSVLQSLRGYKPEATYPNNNLGRQLRSVAALIASGQSTRVYFVSLGGFDTHANQTQRHTQLLRELSTAMAAFQQDLKAHKLDDQVLTMTFSEFGRRPSENASGGTDHGTAAPLFVMGSNLKDSLLGTAPDLNVAKNQDLSHTTDFRQVYSSVLERWLQASPEKVLGRRFDPLGFI